MKDLTIEKAYELAVKKWEYIVENDGSGVALVSKYPEMLSLLAGCSYCEIFMHKGGDYNCKGCPIRPKRKTERNSGCCQPSHPFTKWAYDKTKANAQAVLDLIIKTKPF